MRSKTHRNEICVRVNLGVEVNRHFMKFAAFSWKRTQQRFPI